MQSFYYRIDDEIAKIPNEERISKVCIIASLFPVDFEFNLSFVLVLLNCNATMNFGTHYARLFAYAKYKYLSIWYICALMDVQSMAYGSRNKRNIWLAHERLTNQLNSAPNLRQNNFAQTLYVHPQILRIAIQIMIYALI